jgi:hypothetical protein
LILLSSYTTIFFVSMIKNAEEKRLKEEELDNDKRMAIQDSKHQLDNNKHLDDKRLLHFENAKKEMEMESKERVASLQSQLTDSYKKMQEMEYQSSRLKATLREKEDKWQKSPSRLLKEFKVFQGNWFYGYTHVQHVCSILPS